MKKFFAILFLIALIHPALAVTLAFDELPYQPVDGLSLTGVTFGFTVAGVDSSDAYYHSDAIGSLVYLQDPVLEGDATGILSLNFSRPTARLGFGVALRNFGFFNPGFTVELFDSSSLSLGIMPVPMDSLVSFTEAFFSYAGMPISRAIINFDESIASRFAMDNLTFDMPAPPSIFLVGVGLSAMGFVQSRNSLRKRRRHLSEVPA